jgi:hypothetical protein
MPSPITGSAGNIEFLVHARTPSTGSSAPFGTVPDIDGLVERAVAEAHAENRPG